MEEQEGHYMIGSDDHEHLGYIKSENQSQPTGHHFNLPEDKWSNMKVRILKKCKEDNLTFRNIRIILHQSV